MKTKMKVCVRKEKKTDNKSTKLTVNLTNRSFGSVQVMSFGLSNGVQISFVRSN